MKSVEEREAEREKNLKASRRKVGGWTGHCVVGLSCAVQGKGSARLYWSVNLYEARTARTSKTVVWSKRENLKWTDYSNGVVFNPGPPEPPTEVIEIGRKVAEERGLEFRPTVRHNTPLDPVEALIYGMDSKD